MTQDVFKKLNWRKRQVISKIHISVTGLLLLVLLFSCKRDTEKKIEERNYDFSSVPEKIDILEYKVKQENFRNDSLSLSFKQVFLERIEENDFDLNVKFDFSPEALEYHNDYYIVFSVYPLDDEIHLLRKDSQKYKFETFSTKIKKKGLNELIISRKINTKLKFARAITISVVAYETKQKSAEVVLQNVNFLKQKSAE